MPQLFQVLKCFKCGVFQVHQRKKSNKWECKMCGEKQSIKRHYGLGTGKECRLHVQKLNGIRGEIDEQNVTTELNQNSEGELVNNIEQRVSVRKHTNNKSKWSNFVDETELLQKQEENKSMYLGNTEVVLEVPVKKKKFKPPTVESSPSFTSYELKESSHNFESNEPIYNFGSSDLVNNHLFHTNEPSYRQMTPEPYASNSNNFIKTKSFNFPITVSNPEILLKENSAPYKLTSVEKSREQLNIETENHTKTYIPPKETQNSKWAEFVDVSDEIDSTISRENSPENVYQSHDKLIENVIPSQDNIIDNIICQDKLINMSPKASSSKNVVSIGLFMFSSCNEEELDDILQF